ncbi:flagellar motor/biogenesis protein FlaJ [Natrialba magadii ATCC 43099]|uniref:Flagellar assembly protein J n=1 Tax=Natrialba magadii (strain ATCC 43099 / DSM 3394 / CCM 3739 / CIP 104546 / IAM 13178 / JCM 8861 / NBRC 102185 / NCIMB 2190 / MS3) TaxID=547559 RepID=D3T0E3_NATMM|nr:archaellar assembly protein FlaJ [Natrialba magadii]ADD06422.1 flagellar motor/biogenesis protein FlaJ [Natrialba magadii ATCC 43099]ELY31691.1 flagellar assembly protein J [Natrialba magadii ATCC 43099]
MGIADNTAAINDLSKSIIRSYDEMDLPARLYVPGVLLPAFLFFLATIVIAVALDVFVLVKLLIPVLGLLVFVAAVGYPRLAVDQRRIEMENRFHLFIIHMTILSTTNIDRMEVLRRLAQEEEYGELADEVQRVVDLVDVWHLSLGDACRRRAKAVPSESVADLFERMAYTLGAGQQLDEFLHQEQDVLVEKYSTVYRQSLGNLDVLKDLYLSLIISMTFALVFAIVLPLLTGNDPTLTTSIVIVLFVFIQIGFFFVIRAVVPDDPIWYLEDGYRTATKKRMLASTVVGVGLSVLTVILLGLIFLGVLPEPGGLPIRDLPSMLHMPIATLPLLIPGLVFWYEERRAFQRDRAFPNFIRALGTSESAKQSTTSEVLATLRSKDFGPLTENVDDLYRRLNMRLSTEKSWRYFTGEANTFLIQKFSEMYLVGREMGGGPKRLGELISTNMSEIINLREERKQQTTTLVGVMYGITAASAFAFFIGLELALMLSSFDIDLDGQMGGQLIHTDEYNVPVLRYLIVLVLIFNAFISSLVLRVADGGHFGNSYVHFTALLWIGAVTGTLTERLVDLLITVDL